MHFQPVRYFGKLSARDENGFMNNVFSVARWGFKITLNFTLPDSKLHWILYTDGRKNTLYLQI